MTKVSDVFGVSPKTVLNKPYLKVRDGKAVGVDGGSSVIGTNTRVLNTLSENSIAGASLASNQILLPAGSYYAEGYSCLYKTGESLVILRDANDGYRILARGPNVLLASSTEVSDGIAFSGAFTLATSGALELACFCDNAQATNGLGRGRSGSGGVFSEVHIWQLDAEIRTPVVHQPVNPAISSEPVTGGWFGGGILSVSGNVVTMRAFSVMDDTLTTAIYKDSTTALDLGTPTINTVYNIFAVKYDDNSYGYEADTDINGANLPANVDYKRWDSFVLIDSGGSVKSCAQMDDHFKFLTKQTVGTAPVGSTILSLAAYIPVERAQEFTITMLSNSSSLPVRFYQSGISTTVVDCNQGTNEAISHTYPNVEGGTFKVGTSTTTAAVNLISVKLRR